MRRKTFDILVATAGLFLAVMTAPDLGGQSARD